MPTTAATTSTSSQTTTTAPDHSGDLPSLNEASFTPAQTKALGLLHQREEKFFKESQNLIQQFQRSGLAIDLDQIGQAPIATLTKEMSLHDVIASAYGKPKSATIPQALLNEFLVHNPDIAALYQKDTHQDLDKIKIAKDSGIDLSSTVRGVTLQNSLLNRQLTEIRLRLDPSEQLRTGIIPSTEEAEQLNSQVVELESARKILSRTLKINKITEILGDAETHGLGENTDPVTSKKLLDENFARARQIASTISDKAIRAETEQRIAIFETQDYYSAGLVALSKENSAIGSSLLHSSIKASESLVSPNSGLTDEATKSLLLLRADAFTRLGSFAAVDNRLSELVGNNTRSIDIQNSSNVALRSEFNRTSSEISSNFQNARAEYERLSKLSGVDPKEIQLRTHQIDLRETECTASVFGAVHDINRQAQSLQHHVALASNWAGGESAFNSFLANKTTNLIVDTNTGACREGKGMLWDKKAKGLSEANATEGGRRLIVGVGADMQVQESVGQSLETLARIELQRGNGTRANEYRQLLHSMATQTHDVAMRARNNVRAGLLGAEFFNSIDAPKAAIISVSTVREASLSDQCRDFSGATIMAEAKLRAFAERHSDNNARIVQELRQRAEKIPSVLSREDLVNLTMIEAYSFLSANRGVDARATITHLSNAYGDMPGVAARVKEFQAANSNSKLVSALQTGLSELNKGSIQEITVYGLGGAITGAVTGGIIGSAGGPAGTLIGGAGGFIIGGALGTGALKAKNLLTGLDNIGQAYSSGLNSISAKESLFDSGGLALDAVAIATPLKGISAFGKLPIASLMSRAVTAEIAAEARVTAAKVLAEGAEQSLRSGGKWISRGGIALATANYIDQRHTIQTSDMTDQEKAQAIARMHRDLAKAGTYLAVLHIGNSFAARALGVSTTVLRKVESERATAGPAAGNTTTPSSSTPPATTTSLSPEGSSSVAHTAPQSTSASNAAGPETPAATPRHAEEASLFEDARFTSQSSPHAEQPAAISSTGGPDAATARSSLEPTTPTTVTSDASPSADPMSIGWQARMYLEKAFKNREANFTPKSLSTALKDPSFKAWYESTDAKGYLDFMVNRKGDKFRVNEVFQLVDRVIR